MLTPVFENHLWQNQTENQVWLLTSPQTPNIFSSVLDDLKNNLSKEWGGLFPQSPRGASPVGRGKYSSSYISWTKRVNFNWAVFSKLYNPGWLQQPYKPWKN